MAIAIDSVVEGIVQLVVLFGSDCTAVAVRAAAGSLAVVLAVPRIAAEAEQIVRTGFAAVEDTGPAPVGLVLAVRIDFVQADHTAVGIVELD